MAKDLLERAYELQEQGELDLAADLYQRSIDAWPTAEAYTYLGWTYRHQGRLEDAIDECRKAIELDPQYGAPYNDIGAYLIELGRPEEAIPWLEKAIASQRYESHHFPWYNLGRVYLAKEMYNKAQECFATALEMESEFDLAIEAIKKVRGLLQ